MQSNKALFTDEWCYAASSLAAQLFKVFDAREHLRHCIGLLARSFDDIRGALETKPSLLSLLFTLSVPSRVFLLLLQPLELFCDVNKVLQRNENLRPPAPCHGIIRHTFLSACMRISDAPARRSMNLVPSSSTSSLGFSCMNISLTFFDGAHSFSLIF